MGGACHPSIEGELIAGGDRKASVVLICVHEVGLDRVESLRLAHVHPGFHDRLEGGTPDVNPIVIRKAV